MLARVSARTSRGRVAPRERCPWVQLSRASTLIVVVVRLTSLEHHEVRHGHPYRHLVGRSRVALSSSEPLSTLSALQSGVRTLVLNTIARRVAVDIRREACRTAHIRAVVVDVGIVCRGVKPEHQGCHRREACDCMKAVQADLRGQKSLCYAPLDQVRTTTVS